MQEPTVATLADIRAITQCEWPSNPDEVRDLLRSHFVGRPHLQEGLTFGPDGLHVGWFVIYESADSVLDEHRDFCAALSTDIGAPTDVTPTTTAWRTGKFVIESYAHPQNGRDPHSSHQLGISFYPN